MSRHTHIEKALPGFVLGKFLITFAEIYRDGLDPSLLIYRKSMKRLIFSLLSLLAAMAVEAQPAWFTFNHKPNREVRAVWLTTIGGLDWPHSYSQSERSAQRQQQELCRILDEYEQLGINTVLIQTRIRATTIYPSAYEPWDGCLSGVPGTSPGYDALKFAIDECHKRGMELHAWVVTMPVGKWNGYGCQQLRKRHGNLLKKIGPDGYLNPEKEATGDYLADICEEIVRNYDVDGIHLDYIRYPETWPQKTDKQTGRSHITGIVRKIHDRVKGLKPWVKMSCSPVGKYTDLTRYWSHGWNAYDKVCQDAQGWLRDGLMDELFPMMYFRGDQFYPFAIDWKENDYGKIVATGLGIYFLHPQEANWQLQDITREMEVNRSIGLGHCFFRGKFLTDNTKGIMDFTKMFNSYPALVPAMTWISHEKPAKPKVERVKGENVLRVDAPKDTYINIYVDGQLTVARRQLDVIPYAAGRRYEIRAINRYGNESEGAFYPLPAHPVDETPIGLLECNNQMAQVPLAELVSPKDMVCATDMQGRLVRTLRRRGTMVDVSSLPDGMYCLRSINRKGKTYRLGMFKVRRH